MTEPPDGWHGWAMNNSAVWISPAPDTEFFALSMQQGRSTSVLAYFSDAESALALSDWLDVVLRDVGRANTDLLKRLRHEQPLLFNRPRDE